MIDPNDTHAANGTTEDTRGGLVPFDYGKPPPRGIFPSDTRDPTAGTKEEEYHVERTLGVMGHVGKVTRHRKEEGWRYLKVPESSKEARSTRSYADAAMAQIRRTYECNGPIERGTGADNETWAIWTEAGEPTCPAFDTSAPAPAEDVGLVLSAGPPNTKTYDGNAFPDRPGFELYAKTYGSTTVAKSYDGNAFPIEGDAPAIMFGVAEARIVPAVPVPGDPGETPAGSWAYSSLKPFDVAAFRKRLGVRDDAPYAFDNPGNVFASSVLAVWTGPGEPTRPAFPDSSIAEAVRKNMAEHGNAAEAVAKAFEKQYRDFVSSPTTSISPEILRLAGGSEDVARRILETNKAAKEQEEQRRSFAFGNLEAQVLAKEQEEQRRSFAFGNTNLSNPDVTRETVDKAAETMKERPTPRLSPHAPANALNDMGLKIYGLARDANFNPGLRAWLMEQSDAFHLRANAFEVASLRAAYDLKRGK